MKSHFELLLLIAQKYSLLNVTAICFLGLLFDTYLKYSSQVQVLVRTCIKMCKMYTALKKGRIFYQCHSQLTVVGTFGEEAA